MTTRLILGSGSPRRLELLSQLGVVPDEVSPPDIDETPFQNEVPRRYCTRIAEEKAGAISGGPDDVILCADTTVALGRRILGKPEGPEEAADFLRLLSGRRHKVITAICVKRASKIWFRDVVSQVRMKALSKSDVDTYLASEDWRGKAGGYAIQGPAGAFIPWISGSFTGIVGLPLSETANLLRCAGYPGQ